MVLNVTRLSPCVPSSVRSPCRQQCRRRQCVARSSQPTPDAPNPNDAMARAAQDPEVRKAIEEQLKSPAVQAQAQQMAEMAKNPALQERLKELRGDPEVAQMFEEIEKGGMQALMKYWDDPQMLQKLGQKLGDVPMQAAAQAAPAASAAPVADPEVNDLFDAAKLGDLEAAEDFVAIGKDINMRDSEKRTPLHYATAHDHSQVVRFFLQEGADKELMDAKNNTPLHYATGYGRVDITEILLDAGADVTARNLTGKTAADLARLNGQNPILAIPEVMERLDASVSA